MIVYNLGIRIFYLILKLSSYLNPKAKLWVEGRENWKNELQEKVNHLKLNSPIWFHCASLGEFEQGRPVIEKIKQIYPQQKVLITFFSPSGYEIQKNYLQTISMLRSLINKIPFSSRNHLPTLTIDSMMLNGP